MNIASVFVHLGKNPAPQLNAMAIAMKKTNPQGDAYLITDEVDAWQEFPGQVIRYSRKDRHELIQRISTKNKALEQVAGGYWLYTFERLFALDKIYTLIDPEHPFIHYESDVLPILRQTDVELLQSKVSRTAVPRFSKVRGIASILYSPSQSEYRRVLSEFSSLLQDDPSVINDMDLLGLALNKNIIDELPTTSTKAWKDLEDNFVFFDGAAIGQYLFGQDPFHTNNRRISGYRNPSYPEDLTSWTWELVNFSDNTYGLTFKNHENTRFRLLNLHVHSKQVIAPPGIDEDWEKVINEANGVSVRVESPYIPNQIHTIPISILNRFRLARNRGLLISGLGFGKRLLKKFTNYLKT